MATKLEIKHWKISEIDSTAREKLMKYVENIEIAAFNNYEKVKADEDFDKVEAAIEQRFTNPDEFAVTDDGEPVNINIEEFTTKDMEGRLYMPLLAEQSIWLEGHLRRVTIPVNRQFFRVQFNSRTKLARRFPVLKPVFERAWMDYYATSFDQAHSIPKIKQLMKQAVRAANTVGMLDYDADLSLIDLLPQNFRDFAIYPPKGDPSKCKQIMRYAVDITDLKHKATIDQDILNDIIPESQVLNVDYYNKPEGKSNKNVAYDQVKLVTIFIPHYKCFYQKENEKKKQVFEIENALVMMAYNQSGSNEEGEAKPSKVLLQVTELPSRQYNPFIFARLRTPMPKQIYVRNALKPYIVHNATLNLLTSSMARAGELSAEPPFFLQDDTNLDTENFQINPGMVLSNPAGKEAGGFVDYNPDLNAMLAIANFIVAQAEKGMAITPMMKGQMSGGASARKSATEAERERESGEVPVDDIAEHLEFDLFQQLIFKQGLLSQMYIQAEVEEASKAWEEELENAKKKGSDVVPTEEQKWDFIVDNSPMLFKYLDSSRLVDQIQAKLEEVGITQPEVAKANDSMMTMAEIYEAIIDPLKITDIKVEGSVNQVTQREDRADFLDFTDWVFNPNIQALLKLRQKGVDVDQLIDRAKTLFNIKEDFIITFQALLKKGQQLMDQVQNVPGQENADPNVTIPEDKNIEKPAIEQPAIEQPTK